jgi:hypothetical protein
MPGIGRGVDCLKDRRVTVRDTSGAGSAAGTCGSVSSEGRWWDLLAEMLLSREREDCDVVEVCLVLRLLLLPLTSGVRVAGSSVRDGCSACGVCGTSCETIGADAVLFETRVKVAGRAGTVDEDEGTSLPLKGTKVLSSGIRFPVP